MNNLCLFCKQPLLIDFVLGAKVSLRERICESCWHVLDKSPAPLNLKIVPIPASIELPHF